MFVCVDIDFLSSSCFSIWLLCSFVFFVFLCFCVFVFLFVLVVVFVFLSIVVFFVFFEPTRTGCRSQVRFLGCAVRRSWLLESVMGSHFINCLVFIFMSPAFPIVGRAPSSFEWAVVSCGEQFGATEE